VGTRLGGRDIQSYRGNMVALHDLKDHLLKTKEELE
jgi:hypothetical protein